MKTVLNLENLELPDVILIESILEDAPFGLHEKYVIKGYQLLYIAKMLALRSKTKAHADELFQELKRAVDEQS